MSRPTIDLTEPLNLEQFEDYMSVCGPCDAGMDHLPCMCIGADVDLRPVIAALVNEIRRQRGER